MAKRSKRRAGAGSRTAPDAISAKASTRGFDLGRDGDWLPGLLLLMAVIVAYMPVWWAGYIWDDDLLVTINPVIVGPLGLKEIWTTNAADICPFTLTTFWLEHAVWGAAPMPFHVVNVLMHGASAILLWRVLRSLQIPGAWLGAALWALHPVQVESVAWISEMKNTESCLFYLIAILFFVKALKANPSERSFIYFLMLLFAALAMASKSSTVILPVVLLLCAWWSEGRFQARMLSRIAPVFLMSIAAGLVSMWTQKSQMATLTESISRSWPERLTAAGDTVWFYLAKLIWPHPLMMIYPLWRIDIHQGLFYLPALATIAVLFLLWFKRDTWARPWFFAFAYFLAGLLPTLGLFDNYIFRYSLVFDHFQYLASMGPLALVGAGLVWLSDRMALGEPLRASAGAILILLVGMLTWHQSGFYENEKTLWTHTLRYNPGAFSAHNNYGNWLLKNGQIPEAEQQFEQALRIDPNYDQAHYNLGNTFQAEKRLPEAIAEYEAALRLNPKFEAVHDNFGNTLLQAGQAEKAIEQFEEALRANPNEARAHNGMAVALANLGQFDAALEQVEAALRIDPNYASAKANLIWLQGKQKGAPSK